jgi:hypothetical protein
VDAILFDEATLNGFTRFNKTIFSSLASFDHATSIDKTPFYAVTFTDSASVEDTTFTGNTRFHETPRHRPLPCGNVTSLLVRSGICIAAAQRINADSLRS